MRHSRRIARRRLGLWLSGAALAVQMLLPFLVAAEIEVLTQDPFLLVGFDPALSCAHDDNGRPASPKRHNMAACPLCTALAAAHAVTLAAAFPVPPPRYSAAVAEAAPTPTLSVARPHDFYDARGPPARA